MIAALVDELAPALISRASIGYESAAQLLLTAGDNSNRLKSEASFAALCGVSPVPASSGKVTRHRLNQGGDRAAKSALHIIAIGRLRTDDRTKAYVARRVSEGHSKLEAIRCVRHYIAREVYFVIRQRNIEIAKTQIFAVSSHRPASSSPATAFSECDAGERRYVCLAQIRGSGWLVSTLCSINFSLS